MSEIVENIGQFVDYAKTLDGDEKGEAQVFCDRLFQAFGHKGYKEAGATLEFRVKKGKATSFADLMWKPRLLIEMKKAGEKLHLHYRQAFDYWINAVPNRPRYVVLCNFREFYIYDFDKQLSDPVDIVPIGELTKRYTALNFLFPGDRKPQFNNDREAVSRSAADKLAELFRNLTRRISKPIPRIQAQRFVLQLVISMFAEDIDLLPAGTIKTLVDECLENGQNSYDMFGGLFRQMNSPTPATGGRFKGVPYFNGGLFSAIEPIELSRFDLELLGGEQGVATKNWSKVDPAIFGTLFQHSMDQDDRHAMGAHFTSEADIQRIVGPTIVGPWTDRIMKAKTAKDLIDMRRQLAGFRVLDPACGSGNFLYVAFREIARLELRILTQLQSIVSPKEFAIRTKQISAISPKQFFGMDTDSFGVELAKVSLMIAKKFAHDEIITTLAHAQGELSLHDDEALPLDNLDENIRREDALFCDWPEVEAIIGILLQFMDAWTETFADPGKRTTGTGEAWFAIVGPGWSGKLPEGVTRYDAPTNHVWLLGRTQTNGAGDYEKVHIFQHGMRLVPLSEYPGKDEPPGPPPDLHRAAGATPPGRVKALDPLLFFKLFAQAMKANPPHAADEPMVRELANIGLVPGQDFDPSKLTAEQLQTIHEGARAAVARIEEFVASGGVTKPGWTSFQGTLGRYGTNYMARAVTARVAIGANPPEDAVYMSSAADGSGQALNGTMRYRMHFDGSSLPPVRAFWSVTAYDKDGYFIANPINRYAIGDRDRLKFNLDGSLDLYIQSTNPGPDRESNWLPAGDGIFNLTIRLYWPKEAILAGSWRPPALELVP